MLYEDGLQAEVGPNIIIKNVVQTDLLQLNFLSLIWDNDYMDEVILIY